SPAPKMVAPQALALEPELVVEPDRRLVVGEDVQLEFFDLAFKGPFDGLLEQPSADALTPVPGRHHQAESGHVMARRVGVAREREPADDPALVLGHEDRGVRGAPDSAQVPPFLPHVAPVSLGDQPGLGLGADRAAKLDESSGVGGDGAPNDEPRHTTTPPWPAPPGAPPAGEPPPSPPP